MSFPHHGEPYDTGDGSWTVVGFHTEFPAQQWQQIKARKRHHWIMRVSDDAADDPSRFRHDPVVIVQVVLGLIIVVPAVLGSLGPRMRSWISRRAEKIDSASASFFSERQMSARLSMVERVAGFSGPR